MDPEKLTAPIHGIGAHGEGVGRLPDGRTVFVHRTCPGDTASVEVVKEADRWARGRLVELLVASPDRRTPPCRFYEDCGGCSLQHIPYSAQLRWKRVRVEETLARIAGIEAVVESIIPSPDELHYRSRVTLHVRRLTGGRVVAGFHRLWRSREVLDVDGACLLMDPLLSEVWDRLRSAWGPGARFLPAGRSLDLTLQKVGNGVVLVVRGGKGQGDARALLDAVPGLHSIWKVSRHESELLAGPAAAVEKWAGDELVLGPTAFLQANGAAAALLWELLAAEIGDVAGRRIVDAYCGAGAFARRWAREGADVVGIELNGDAAGAARTNAPPGLRVVEGPVEQHLPEVLPADVALLNPPRTGVAQAVVEALLASPTGILLYVSCDPATLARDLGRLAGGYDLVRLQAVDLFPQTGHVEVLATLRSR